MVYQCKFGKRLKSGKCPKKKGKKAWIPYDQWLLQQSAGIQKAVSNGRKKWVPYSQWKSQQTTSILDNPFANTPNYQPKDFQKKKAAWQAHVPNTPLGVKYKEIWETMTPIDYYLTIGAGQGKWPDDASPLKECTVEYGSLKGSPGFKFPTGPCFSKFSTAGRRMDATFHRDNLGQEFDSWKENHPDYYERSRGGRNRKGSLTRLLEFPNNKIQEILWG